MTKQEALIDAEWARALYEGWRKYGDCPIYEDLVREYGRPVLVVGSS